MDIKNCCAFTGHRPSHFGFGYNEGHPDCMALKQAMKDNIISLIKKGVTTYLSGMALGVDMWAAELVLELKKEHRSLRLISVLPCETQAVNWSVAQRERYYNILAECDEEIFVNRQYTRSCMMERNRYLVDHAAHLLAVYDGGGKGGTAYTVKYAEQKGREIIIIRTSGNTNVIDFNEI
ncbi:DUF1273 domain-containing protein [Clostridiaceae bacterium OttesenSCG-928-D20]|nr:DUF1273 domain-containing protein [Clostridiaceae bacterium OttesenSCG-928-D20]